MWRSQIRALCTLIIYNFGFAIWLNPTAYGQESLSAEQLIQGVVARYEAIFSGKFKYKSKSGFRNKPGENSTERLTLIFFHTSWKQIKDIPMSEMVSVDQKGNYTKKYPESPHFSTQYFVSHNGKAVEFSSSPYIDGGNYAARVLLEEPRRIKSANFPPFTPGSFWYECTKNYMQANPNQMKQSSGIKLNGLDVVLMDWEIPPVITGPRPFHSTSQFTKQGGHLKVYTCPELGYVLPRIEYVGTNGKVDCQFDAKDFVLIGNSMYIPKQMSMQYLDIDGPGYFVEHELEDISNINAEFPKSEFILELPVGTKVSDSRPGKSSSWFVVQSENAVIPDDLSDIITVRSRFWKRNPITALLLGGVIGLGLLALGYLWTRRKNNIRGKVK